MLLLQLLKRFTGLFKNLNYILLLWFLFSCAAKRIHCSLACSLLYWEKLIEQEGDQLFLGTFQVARISNSDVQIIISFFVL